MAVTTGLVPTTETETTAAPIAASSPYARWNARSCALQYGHQEPRLNSTTP